MSKVAFCCGRFNPPTVGHQKLVEALADANVQSHVFLTKTHDRLRNPLEPKTKQKFVERALGVPVRLTVSPFTALEELVKEGAEDLVFIVGEDRFKQFEPLVTYAEKLGVRLVLKSLSRTDDEVSATQARQAVLENDRNAFRSLVPSPHEGFADELFEAVRSQMSGE